MKWLLLIVFFLANYAYATDEDTAKNTKIRLVTARVDSVKLLELDPDPGMSVAANKFQVVLSDIEIIHGNPQPIEGKVKTFLYADDLYEIERAGKIALLVEYTTKRDFNVLSWQPIRQFACFSLQDIDKNFEKYYWDEKWGGRGKCIFLLRHVYDEDEP